LELRKTRFLLAFVSWSSAKYGPQLISARARAQILCSAQQLSESQILDAFCLRNHRRPFGYFIETSIVSVARRLGMKLERLRLTPSLPSFENQSSEFVKPPDWGLPRARRRGLSMAPDDS
jgi:hypothetical protein